MIFNGKNLNFEYLIKPYRNKAKLLVGDIIEFLYDDETIPIQGCKSFKKGKYKILEVRKSFLYRDLGLVYVLQLNRKNATYKWVCATESIDYSIDNGYILICNENNFYMIDKEYEEKNEE